MIIIKILNQILILILIKILILILILVNLEGVINVILLRMYPCPMLTNTLIKKCQSRKVKCPHCNNCNAVSGLKSYVKQFHINKPTDIFTYYKPKK